MVFGERGSRVGVGRGLAAAVAVLLVLAVPSLVGGDLVEAQKVEPTDTTAVEGSGTDADGARSDHCPYGEVTINPGTPDERVKCRACKRKTYYSSGGCRPVPEDLVNCSAGEAIVSTWPGRCVPIRCPDNDDSDICEWRNPRTGRCTRPLTCPHGRNPVTGHCNPAPPSVTLAKPEGVRVDGDSPSVEGGEDLAGDKGRSVVRWGVVDNATGYVVRHNLPAGCDDPPCSGWKEYPVTGGLKTTITLPRLDRYTLYTVQVAAKRGSRRSGWSDVVYTYPTREPLPRRGRPTTINRFEKVGFIPVGGFLDTDTDPVGHYSYTICEDTLSSVPITAGAQKRRIEQGIKEWADSTGMVTYEPNFADC